MIDNTALLRRLLQEGQIAMEDGNFLSSYPAPLPEGWDFARVEGMLLGLAVGDALGNTTEAQLPAQRIQVYGEIRDYLPNRYAGMRRAGTPSDDTQMAFWTLEQLLEDGGLLPDRLAQKFTRQQIYGIGQTVKAFLSAYKDRGKPWSEAGQPSAGNGALMRIAPVLIPHLRRPSPALWADAALAGMVTHNDPASNACCVAFTHILWECLCMKRVPEPVWWVDAFSAAASQMEGQTHHSPRHENINGQGPLWQYVDREVRRAIQENWTAREACDRWYSGAYLLETMPCALYILARHADDPEQALIRSVNDTKDNDTIAAIVGSAVGALYGREGIPTRWVDSLLGRTGAENDWRIFELIEQARQVFWKADPRISQADIQAVLGFLPVFEQPGFSPGAWQLPPGTLGYYDYSPDVLRFLRALGEHHFIHPFDWMHWVEGRQFGKDLRLVENASLQTLRKLLTMHVRADRFSEGHLASVFESGEMLAILRRLAAIHHSLT